MKYIGLTKLVVDTELLDVCVYKLESNLLITGHK